MAAFFFMVESDKASGRVASRPAGGLPLMLPRGSDEPCHHAIVGDLLDEKYIPT